MYIKHYTLIIETVSFFQLHIEQSQNLIMFWARKEPSVGSESRNNTSSKYPLVTKQ